MKIIRIALIATIISVANSLTAQDMRSIQGTVTDGTNPLKDVMIEVQGKDSRAFTYSVG
ncbi:MAG: hypothetical protein P8X60_04890 [Robiginitalea sp.]